MPTTLANLTTEEFRLLLRDFYAEPIKRNKLTLEEINDLAHRLNKKINIPIMNEVKEGKILVKVILKIDTFLYDHLPNEFYDLIRSKEMGIDDNEAKRLVKRLTRLANEKIDIPYLPEAAEHFVLKFIIGMVVKAARKNLDFEMVRMDSDKILVPESDDDTEFILAN
jgi:hypothetical protein